MYDLVFEGNLNCPDWLIFTFVVLVVNCLEDSKDLIWVIDFDTLGPKIDIDAVWLFQNNLLIQEAI